MCSAVPGAENSGMQHQDTTPEYFFTGCKAFLQRIVINGLPPGCVSRFETGHKNSITHFFAVWYEVIEGKSMLTTFHDQHKEIFKILKLRLTFQPHSLTNALERMNSMRDSTYAPNSYPTCCKPPHEPYCLFLFRLKRIQI